MKRSLNSIYVRGAREHNLKNIHVFIPHNKVTVVTGLSGSGKSSLAFDTVYAEGQRRYVESLSVHARQFLNQLKKPEVEFIRGLCPSIAIEQKTISYNPRSTVGTVTEIYDYLRLLYARVGQPFCPHHKTPLKGSSVDQIFKEVMNLPKGSTFSITAPVVRGKKGEFLTQAQSWLKKGFLKACVDGQWIELSQMKRLSKYKVHDIELLVDRLVVDPKFEERLRMSLKTALKIAEGFVCIEQKGKKRLLYSIKNSCEKCGYSCPDLESNFFSFNNPRGACPDCHGLGSLELKEEGVEYEEADEDIDEWNLERCSTCEGYRLRQEALHVFIGKKHIGSLADMTTKNLLSFIKKVKFDKRRKIISEKIIQQISLRLKYMTEVGTDYLSLSRPTRTLSGGEGQRIRLATQLSSSMTGVLYVLDEPSIGLHPKDHKRLLLLLREIQKRGNTVLLVEHDEESILSSDHVIDLGPGAGRLGGYIVAEGSPEEICKNKKSLTGQYLSRKKNIPIPSNRRKGNGEKLILEGACGNNLKNIRVEIPLGAFCGITGVSGSGKSTLARDTLYRALIKDLYEPPLKPAPYKSLKGIEHIDKVIEINQKPIGRTPRSIPATYVGLFSLIRSLFANLPEAKVWGYRASEFSFNLKGGRCEKCSGHGRMRLKMHFMADAHVLCDVCEGRRYHEETLAIRYREKSISDILNMTVAEACEFFENHRLISKKLKTLERVGLDYLTLGQSSTTLSGGEAQRIKLSRELSKTATGKTLYILDEPTTGLHFEDIRKLISLLHELVEQKNTVLIIEHNLDVIKNCDYILDLGPEGGEKGGHIVAQGSPEAVARASKSFTGQYLKTLLS